MDDLSPDLSPEPDARDEVLAETLARLSRDLHRGADPDTVMRQVVDSAVQLIDGAEHASISLGRHRKQVWSAAATDDVARDFDKNQESLAQGPCLDAMYDEPVVRVVDLRDDSRWPVLGERADALGVRSMLCFQLYVHDDSMGGLNVLSSKPNAFDEDAEIVGAMIATHAAIALADSQKLEDLRHALVNRDLIGQAKGILMERFKIDADQAFALLTRVSQDRNVKLHRLAEELATTGTLRR